MKPESIRTGFIAPPGIDAAVLSKLSAEVKLALADPNVVEKLRKYDLTGSELSATGT